MTHFNRQQLADLRRRLNAARQEAIDSGHTKHACKTPYIDPATGQPYRLELKPRGSRRILEAAGHECVDVAGKGLHVKIPLGEHGIDHLGIDPFSGEVHCTLCHGQTKAS